MIHPKELPPHYWPGHQYLERQYVVVDDQGRYGIASATARDEGHLWAHPINMQLVMTAGRVPGTETLPSGAGIITDTRWHLKPDGTWHGIWCDYNGPSHIPDSFVRRLTIVDDLGWRIPDRWVEDALTGIDLAAKAQAPKGQRRIKGKTADEMTVGQAEEFAREVGEKASARGIRLAAKRGYIPGARKAGRDWLIPYEGFNHYLDHRPRPGRKPTK